MILGFIGQRNSGKTLSMTINAYKKYKQGYKIYSNYHLNFPHVRVTINELLEFAESGIFFGRAVICLDELHVWFDSRGSSMAKRNKIFSYFLNQSSKNDLDIYYTTQYARQVDIRIRLNTEIVTNCSCKAIIWKTASSKPRILENERPKPNDYRCKAYITCKSFKFSDTGQDKVSIRVYNGEKYYCLYDTREVVKQQSDAFKDALKLPQNKGVKIEKITYKEKRVTQHNNRLFHQQNEALVRGL